MLEKNEKRLLIDPGTFSFIEKKFTPEDIGPVDIILLTHEHGDHFFPDALKKIITLNKPVIFTHQRLSKLCAENDIESNIIKSEETISQDGFIITGLEAPHEKVVTETPHNIGFIIDGKIIHPGDSLSFTATSPEVLFAPITAPWLNEPDALACVRRVKPKITIPIHDAFVKDFFLQGMYNRWETALKDIDSQFKPLILGASLEISD